MGVRSTVSSRSLSNQWSRKTPLWKSARRLVNSLDSGMDIKSSVGIKNNHRSKMDLDLTTVSNSAT